MGKYQKYIYFANSFGIFPDDWINLCANFYPKKSFRVSLKNIKRLLWKYINVFHLYAINASFSSNQILADASSNQLIFQSNYFIRPICRLQFKCAEHRRKGIPRSTLTFQTTWWVFLKQVRPAEGKVNIWSQSNIRIDFRFIWFINRANIGTLCSDNLNLRLSIISDNWARLQNQHKPFKLLTLLKKGCKIFQSCPYSNLQKSLKEESKSCHLHAWLSKQPANRILLRNFVSHLEMFSLLSFCRRISL